MAKFVDSWRRALRNRHFTDQLLVTLAALLVAILLMRAFMNYTGARMGAVLSDPLLDLFIPEAFPLITFSFVYAGFLLGIVFLFVRPFSLLLVLRAMVVLIFLRAICQFFLPLDPPPDAIPLADPFIRIPGFRHVAPRDLFFSWHTALLTLLAFVTQGRDLKIIFAVFALIVSVLMLLQHAHYTIDIIAAPCFSYAACGLARWFTVQEFAAR
jgi:hypothetical protein